jgi:ribosome-binding factor A
METKRQLQIGELIKRNLGIVLQSEGTYIYGPSPLVTVTNVKMSPDLSIAKAYLSVYNVEDKQTVILEIEEHYTRIRQSLGNRIKRQVRRIPNLQFYLDDTLDEMYRLNQLFDRLDEDKQLGQSSED